MKRRAKDNDEVLSFGPISSAEFRMRPDLDNPITSLETQLSSLRLQAARTARRIWVRTTACLSKFPARPPVGAAGRGWERSASAPFWAARRRREQLRGPRPACP